MIQLTPSIIGKHAIIDLSGCDAEIMRNRTSMLDILNQAAQIANVTVVGHIDHYFSLEGYSAVLILEESHLSIHTWPEYNHVSLDLYSCNLDTDFEAVETFLAKQFKATTIESQLIHRKLNPATVSAPLPLREN